MKATFIMTLQIMKATFIVALEINLHCGFTDNKCILHSGFTNNESNLHSGFTDCCLRFPTVMKFVTCATGTLHLLFLILILEGRISISLP